MVFTLIISDKRKYDLIFLFQSQKTDLDHNSHTCPFESAELTLLWEEFLNVIITIYSFKSNSRSEDQTL